MAKTIAMVIAERTFRDEEYQVPKEIMIKAGMNVITVSTTVTRAVGKLGLEVKPDLLIKDLPGRELDALIFVGGGGSSQYFEDPLAHRLANDYYNQGKIVGAICIAPVILANAGLLRGKKATVFESGADQLTQQGATYTGAAVELDGRILTGNGPEASRAYGEALVRLLNGTP